MTLLAGAAWALLIAAAVEDARRGRVPNRLVAAALVLALLAEPQAGRLAAVAVAPTPWLIAAALRLSGMGDAKLGAVVGALIGLAAVPWWWLWGLLAAALTLTAGRAVGRARAPLPLAPGLVVAAALAAVGVGH